jgi:hypothetical protein
MRPYPVNAPWTGQLWKSAGEGLKVLRNYMRIKVFVQELKFLCREGLLCKAPGFLPESGCLLRVALRCSVHNVIVRLLL